jgi:hypothetical protein
MMNATLATLTHNQRRIMTEIACYDGYAERSQLPEMRGLDRTLDSLVELDLLRAGWNSDIQEDYWELTPAGRAVLATA